MPFLQLLQLFSLNLDTNIWTEEGRVNLKQNIQKGTSETTVKQNSDGTTIETTHSSWSPEDDE